jgi:hypothetical protein
VSGLDYIALLEAVKTKLAEIAPGKTVRRTFQLLDHEQEPQLAQGIYMVLASGVQAYPWDRTDSADASPDGPGATALPVFAWRVLGRKYVGETATGEQIEAAEFEMIEEIEELADELVRDEDLDEHEELCRTVLRGIDMSNQLEAPYAWVVALFVLDVR